MLLGTAWRAWRAFSRLGVQSGVWEKKIGVYKQKLLKDTVMEIP